MLGEGSDDRLVGFAFFGTGGDFNSILAITCFGDLCCPLTGFDVNGEFHARRLAHHLLITGNESVESR